MVSILKKALSVLAVSVLATLGAAAQDGTSPSPQSGSTTGQGSHSAYRSEVFTVKHRRPRLLAEVLDPLRSGASGTGLSASDELNTISVRDFPENIATIGDAIRRLDVVEPTPSDIEIHLHVLLASQTGTSGDLPAEIKNAVARIQDTLNYKAFTVLAPIVARASEDRDGPPLVGKGAVSSAAVDSAGPLDARYIYSMNRIVRGPDSAGVPRVEISQFTFSLAGSLGEAQLSSNLSLRDGEQVVVGSASLSHGRALVLIISAKPVP